jgi:hypothetical protein
MSTRSGKPNKRRSSRRDLTYGATVLGIDEVPLGRCVIIDISETGVRLAAIGDFVIPDEFLLALTPSRAVQRTCEVVWRNDDEVGSRFKQVDIDEVATKAKNLRRRRIAALPLPDSGALGGNHAA